MKNLTVIIPTYNRTKELSINLNILKDIINGRDIPIIISDDGSNKEHVRAIENEIKLLNENIRFFTNEVNVGLEENELFLISKVETKYAMLLGEDDYLNKKLFDRILSYLDEDTNITAIIPNFYGVDTNRSKLRKSRFKVCDDKFYDRGDLDCIYMAHQMSGLVFKVDGLVESYRKLVPHNVYPHLYFIGYNILRGKLVHITRNPFENTVVKKKQFDYSIDNLTRDILSILLSFDVDQSTKISAISSFLTNDLTRYCNPYTWLHPFTLLRRIDEYHLDKDVEKMMKIEFLKSYFKIPKIVYKYIYARLFKNSKSDN